MCTKLETVVITTSITEVKLSKRKAQKTSKLDVFIDNTGNTKIIESGYEIIGPFGKLILVGVPRKGNNINIFSLPLHFGKEIIGSHGGECDPSKDIPRFINLFSEKIAFYKELITKRIKLDNINQALELMKEGKTAGRIIIDISWKQKS